MKKIILGVILLMGLFYFVRGGKTNIKNFPNDNRSVVAFGDSLTAGYGAPVGSSYPDVLAQKISRPVVNLGVSGETAAAAPARIDQVLREQPYMVLIEFGANDHMRQQSRQAAINAVAQIVDEVQAAGAIAVIVDTGGPGMGEYTKAYKQMAKEKGALFVPGIIKGIFYKPSLKSDQVHPNAQGYALVADKVHKVIKDYL
ncbi:MAG: hypothetical protein J6Q05_02695 [Elusimicrobiaceae bacterium]|nr:hypothetical protein [Elusimicrobiaceae bacterium]